MIGLLASLQAQLLSHPAFHTDARGFTTPASWLSANAVRLSLNPFQDSTPVSPPGERLCSRADV